ncbi:PREDICTED: uncharacterized protein LOC107881087 [Prunus mume]|uniref:Uncharacterized protein LOC107881087 n=1 Tax=Prunus mume TaxID=102107 RepID=A0ABM1LQG2_PRUMU|nr:PREDICTED: uncharacterized protein LOC107881087 [Prunus mume]
MVYGIWWKRELRFLIWRRKKKAGEALEDEVDEKMAEIFMKDAKALGIIQNAVSNQIFLFIANADSAKMAWDLLYGEYHGGDQVRSAKLQNLRREFEYTSMRDNEPLSDYLTRLNELINLMKTFGEILSNETCSKGFVVSIKHMILYVLRLKTQSLETVELQEVIAILKSQEQWFDLHIVDTAEKAFASYSGSPKGQNKGGAQSGSSKFQKNWNPKGKQWESKPKYKGKPKCYNCDRFGHLARECTSGKIVQKANCASQMEVTGNLFYESSAITEAKINGEWYIDSGCRNHMARNVELLVDIRTNVAERFKCQ